MTLEEMQELADAMETIEHYQKQLSYRIFIIIAKGIAGFISGMLFGAGFFLVSGFFK